MQNRFGIGWNIFIRLYQHILYRYRVSCKAIISVFQILCHIERLCAWKVLREFCWPFFGKFNIIFNKNIIFDFFLNIFVVPLNKLTPRIENWIKVSSQIELKIIIFIFEPTVLALKINSIFLIQSCSGQLDKKQKSVSLSVCLPAWSTSSSPCFCFQIWWGSAHH